jgi:hypothetical protein
MLLTTLMRCILLPLTRTIKDRRHRLLESGSFTNLVQISEAQAHKHLQQMLTDMNLHHG